MPPTWCTILPRVGLGTLDTGATISKHSQLNTNYQISTHRYHRRFSLRPLAEHLSENSHLQQLLVHGYTVRKFQYLYPNEPSSKWKRWHLIDLMLQEHWKGDYVQSYVGTITCPSSPSQSSLSNIYTWFNLKECTGLKA